MPPINLLELDVVLWRVIAGIASLTVRVVRLAVVAIRVLLVTVPHALVVVDAVAGKLGALVVSTVGSK